MQIVRPEEVEGDNLNNFCCFQLPCKMTLLVRLVSWNAVKFLHNIQKQKLENCRKSKDFTLQIPGLGCWIHLKWSLQKKIRK